MSFLIAEIPTLVEDSYSRQLDKQVFIQEKPYGYSTNPPPYWHENEEAIAARKAQHSEYEPYKEIND